MVRGKSHDRSPLLPLGNIGPGKISSSAVKPMEVISDSTIASATMCEGGRVSPSLSCWARPRFWPSTANWLASSTTTSAAAKRPSMSSP